MERTKEPIELRSARTRADWKSKVHASAPTSPGTPAGRVYPVWRAEECPKEVHSLPPKPVGTPYTGQRGPCKWDLVKGPEVRRASGKWGSECNPQHP